MRRDDHPAVLLALVFAVLVLGFASTYSAWVSSTNHHASCARSDVILDTLHDVILLAFTPAPGQKVTAAQERQIGSFELAAFQRIDQSRC